MPILWSSFYGDKPLAPAKPSWAIPEGVEILQKVSHNPNQKFPMVTPRGGDALAPTIVALSLPNSHHLPRQSLNIVPLALKLPS